MQAVQAAVKSHTFSHSSKADIFIIIIAEPGKCSRTKPNVTDQDYGLLGKIDPFLRRLEQTAGTTAQWITAQQEHYPPPPPSPLPPLKQSASAAYNAV